MEDRIKLIENEQVEMIKIIKSMSEEIQKIKEGDTLE